MFKFLNRNREYFSLFTETFHRTLMDLLSLAEPCCAYVNMYQRMSEQYEVCYQENFCEVYSTQLVVFCRDMTSTLHQALGMYKNDPY